MRWRNVIKASGVPSNVSLLLLLSLATESMNSFPENVAENILQALSAEPKFFRNGSMTK